MQYLNYFLDLGSSVVMPVIITILGLVLGQKLSKAFRLKMRYLHIHAPIYSFEKKKVKMRK